MFLEIMISGLFVFQVLQNRWTLEARAEVRRIRSTACDEMFMLAGRKRRFGWHTSMEAADGHTNALLDDFGTGVPIHCI